MRSDRPIRLAKWRNIEIIVGVTRFRRMLTLRSAVLCYVEKDGFGVVALCELIPMAT